MDAPRDTLNRHAARFPSHNAPLVGWKPLSTDPRVAGSRIRCFEPLRVLQAARLPVEQFDEQRGGRYRVVVLQKLYDRSHIELASTLKSRGVKVVFDLCDNHLHDERGDPEGHQRIDRLREMLDLADVVTVPCEELGRYIPRPVVVIRDGITAPAPRRWLGGLSRLGRPRSSVEIVWYGIHAGSQAAGMHDILRIAPLLERLGQRYPLRLTIISDSRSAFEHLVQPLRISSRYFAWRSHADCCRRLTRCDICVIPVTRNPFTNCKSHNRLSLALCLGLAVVADAIPSYVEFSPFCALDRWEEGLTSYIEDRELRRRHASSGRLYVQSRYSADRAALEWWDLFESLTEGKSLGEQLLYDSATATDPVASPPS